MLFLWLLKLRNNMPTYLVFKHQDNLVSFMKKLFVSVSFEWTAHGNYHFLSVFSSNMEKYGPEKTPYLDNFHAVYIDR